MAGAELPADVADMAISHFAVQEPHGARTFNILERWDCPTCGSAEWIEVVVEDGIVQAFATVPLDLGTFRRATYVSEAIIHVYEDRTGESLYVGTEIRRGWQERLIAALENGKQR